jgi:phage gpG-like protein
VPGESHARIDGDRRVRQLLSEMADRTRGIPAQTWEKVGDVIAGAMRQQFASEGSHLLGRQWAPLNPDYLAWKIGKGFRPERLRQTDAMRDSLISRPMAIERYEPLRATFGTDDEKAAFHQNGTSLMPQRKIIHVTDDLADDANSVLARYIFEDRLS